MGIVLANYFFTNLQPISKSSMSIVRLVFAGNVAIAVRSVRWGSDVSTENRQILNAERPAASDSLISFPSFAHGQQVDTRLETDYVNKTDINEFRQQHKTETDRESATRRYEQRMLNKTNVNAEQRMLNKTNNDGNDSKKRAGRFGRDHFNNDGFVTDAADDSSDARWSADARDC